MGIGFKILLAKKKTVTKILADYLQKEYDKSITKKEIYKTLTSWSEPHLEEVYFEIIRKIPLEKYKQYIQEKFQCEVDEEFSNSLGIPFFKHFFKH